MIFIAQAHCGFKIPVNIELTTLFVCCIRTVVEISIEVGVKIKLDRFNYLSMSYLKYLKLMESF